MKTSHCDECEHHTAYHMFGIVCKKGHKPRWYKQRNDNHYDTDYGYKRRCADFEAKDKG